MSDRKTDHATLIAALRILARDIESGDGCANACLLEVAARLETLVEERRSITTLLGKVESLEADNAKLREERRWVPVGERLPEEDGWYIAAIQHDKSGNTGVFVAEFWSDGVFANCDFEDVTVSHWMPLPPEPEAAGNELPTE